MIKYIKTLNYNEFINVFDFKNTFLLIKSKNFNSIIKYNKIETNKIHQFYKERGKVLSFIFINDTITYQLFMKNINYVEFKETTIDIIKEYISDYVMSIIYEYRYIRRDKGKELVPIKVIIEKDIKAYNLLNIYIHYYKDKSLKTFLKEYKNFNCYKFLKIFFFSKKIYFFLLPFDINFYIIKLYNE